MSASNFSTSLMSRSTAAPVRGYGHSDLVVMRPDEQLWQRFLAATQGQPAWGRLKKAASLFDAPGDALDVGAGAGRDTAYLLERGWRVTAVDSSPAAVKVLRGLEPDD